MEWGLLVAHLMSPTSTLITMKRLYPPLWQRNSIEGPPPRAIDVESNNYSSLLKQFSSKPTPKRWFTLFQSSLVVGQEFVLSIYVLARHRLLEKKSQSVQSSSSEPFRLFGILFVALLFLASLQRMLPTKLHHHGHRTFVQRLLHWIRLVVRLVLMATILKHVTNSNFTSTINTLARVGITIHCMGYSYPSIHANRKYDMASRSPSLAFCGTTLLLASKLKSFWTVLYFVSLSTLVFSVHPPIQHGLYNHHPQIAHYVTFLVTWFMSMITWDVLEHPVEQRFFLGILFTMGLVAPTWKYYLQRYKVQITGPWDIAHITIDS